MIALIGYGVKFKTISRDTIRSLDNEGVIEVHGDLVLVRKSGDSGSFNAAIEEASQKFGIETIGECGWFLLCRHYRWRDIVARMEGR